MKLIKSILAIILLLPTLVYAQTTPKATHQFHIEIFDKHNELIQEAEFIYPNPSSKFSIQKKIIYHDLCLKNGNDIEYSDKELYSHFSIDLTEKIGGENALNLNVYFPSFSSINIGDCNIQVPILQHVQLSTVMPIIIYENNFFVINSNGKLTSDKYSIHVNSKKIKY